MPPARELISLNGDWEIAPGELSGPPPSWTSRIKVPSLVDAADPAYPWHDAEYHWYRARFVLPPPRRTESVFVVLEQAMYGTEVRLNGLVVGRDIACYTSQEYEVSSAVRYGGENELLVRVGLRETLPPESAVGNDQERDVFIPGIWGDTWIVRTGNPRIRRVQVIPRIESGAAKIRVFIQNTGREARGLRCTCRVTSTSPVAASGVGVLAARSSNADMSVTGASIMNASSAAMSTVTASSRAASTTDASLAGLTATILTIHLEIPDPRLWSPDDPFLYSLETEIESDGVAQDRLSTSFGMREFRVNGGDFLLNGKKILLRGGNIAFHRFLSDAARGTLPWDLEWAKRLLIDIPKEHHFNMFRAHLGQMYNRWYDLADRYGMLIQNEWPFWTRSGSEEQIRQEFTRWLEDNWNHPSIVLWDPMNESHDDFVAGELVSEMKALDPTRAWEMRDFVDEHPYIFSLGPVLTDRRLGFSRSLAEIEQSVTPSVVNEFLWWWLDPENNPTPLTGDVLERWMGPAPGREEIVAHQSFLARELVELFRRMNVDAIQPFVYLSNGQGPTGHWFLGDVRDLKPKPVLEAIGNAFSPFGVSIELWDRHFLPAERRRVRIFLFNDQARPQAGTLRWGIAGEGGEWLVVAEQAVSVDPVDSRVLTVEFIFPEIPCKCEARAELVASGSTATPALSRKPVHVISSPRAGGSIAGMHPVVLEESGEIKRYLHQLGIEARDLGISGYSDCDIILVADGLARGNEFQRRREELEAFLASGRTLVLIEPEYGVETEAIVPVTEEIALEIRHRPDPDRGGYDSFVFLEDPRHPVWHDIPQDHLKFFNGGLGGEIVSQHDVSCMAPMTVLARCGLKLATVAAAEVAAGGGTIVLSRLQIRGRLTGSRDADTLYGRRSDAVAQRYLLNILGAYGRLARS